LIKNPKNFNELLNVGGTRLAALKAKNLERILTLGHVCSALPPRLAETVVSAGIEQGRLTIGVASASWAARLRYVTDVLRRRVSESMGIDIQSVRVKVVRPRA